MMIMMEKQISYAFLFFVFVVIYIAFHLLVFTMKTRRKTALFIKDSHSKIDYEHFITMQKLNFLISLTILKLIGLILFILCTLRMAMQLTRYLRAAELGDFAFEPMSLTSSAKEFIITHEFFLILMLLPWIVYIIFQFILERRIIKLKTMKRK